jgi:hypothetical protein
VAIISATVQVRTNALQKIEVGRILDASVCLMLLPAGEVPAAWTFRRS